MVRSIRRPPFSLCAHVSALALLACAVCVPLALAAPRAERSANADGAWSQPPIVGPNVGATAVYDAAQDRLIAFGGVDYSRFVYSNRTWARPHGGHWTLLDAVDPTDAIPGMFGACAIEDPVRHRMVLLGNDSHTWQLDLTQPATWQSFGTLSPSPSPRQDGIAFYDPYRDRMVLYGGTEGDVWAFALSGAPGWTQLTATGTPPPASNTYSGAYDVNTKRLIVTNASTTWQLSFAGNDDSPQWSQIAVAGLPVRKNAFAVCDTAGKQLVLFGGFDVNGLPTNTAYSLAVFGPPAWTALSPAGTPPQPRGVGAAAFDPTHRSMLVFGGDGSTSTNLQFSDLWALTLPGSPTWQVLAPEDAASPRSGSLDVGVYDAAGDAFVVAGRLSANPALSYSDQASLSLADLAWTSAPVHVEDSGMGIYDPVLQGIVGFGGYDSHLGTFYNGTGVWPLHGGSAWTVSGDSPPPTSDYLARAIYDSRRHRMIVYGGFPYCLPCSEGWELSLLPPHTWHQFLPTDHAPPAETGITIDDPVRDRLIVWPISATPWALDFTTLTWSPIAASGTPPTTGHPYLGIYDPVRDRLVVWSTAGTWELGLAGSPAWTPLAPDGDAPVPSNEGGEMVAAYDPVRDRMLIQLTDGSTPTSNTYALTWGEPARPVVSCIADATWQRGTKLEVGFGVSNGLAGTRAISWSVTDDRGWPGFPLYGTTIVGGASGQLVTASIATPYTAAAGPISLHVRAWYEGGQGNDATCDQYLADGNTAVPPPAPRVALAIATTANPGRSLRVAYVLPRAGAATLSAYDVGGRRIASQNIDATAGRHEATLGRGPIAPGVYLVVVEQERRTASTRAVIVR